LTRARVAFGLAGLAAALLLVGCLAVGTRAPSPEAAASEALVSPAPPAPALRVVVVPASPPLPKLPDAITAPAPVRPPAPAPPPVPVMRHLPSWVQTRRPAALMSGPDAAAIRFTTLPAWTFMRVVGVEGDRLHVEYAGDGGLRQPGPGWVALDDVQPSDPSGTWLQAHRASSVFDASAEGKSVAEVPQWSVMLALEPRAAERVHVRLYSADYKRVVSEGWIAASDIGPVGPPERGVSTETLAAPPVPLGGHDAFIAALGEAARASHATTGVPASVTLAQAILESNWGESLLTRAANNYFGIKALGRVGNDGVVWMRTTEYDDEGAAYATQAPFRAYKTVVDSVTDHSQLFQRVSLYRAAMRATRDPDEFARRIADAGYSTDPAYASKLIGLMLKYDLYRFDSSP
jgi:Mannosyl-glycoprotein endo-beta-N-acetylglucosaminidase